MSNRYGKMIPVLALCMATLDTMAQGTNEQLKKYMVAAQNATTEEAYAAAMLRADSFARAINDVESQAKINRNLGTYYYDKDADKCIKYLAKAHQLFVTSGNNKDAALCLNNITFAYREKKKDLKEALNYSNKAINAHIELKDTLGMANVYKYQAVVYGELHDYANGKKSAAKAIELFTAKNHKMGVAVSYKDMANVYEEEREYDSAIVWLLKAKAFWTSGENKDSYWWRTYGVNTDLARVYAKAGMKHEADSTAKENDANETGVHYSEKLRFYKDGKEQYRKRDKQRAGVYREKYTVLRDSLQGAGVKVD